MASIKLTKSFPPTTTSTLNITESSRTNTTTKFNIGFITNLGSSSSWVGSGVTYVATVSISGSGVTTQSKSFTLKSSSETWSGTATHTTNTNWTPNIPASVSTITVSVTYKYSDESTTMSGSTTMNLTKMGSTLNNIVNFNLEDNLGNPNKFNISISKYVSTYYDVLTIKTGNTTIKTIEDVLNGDEITFTEEELDNLYQSYTTTINVPLTFVLKTYTNSSKTTQMGSDSIKTCTGYIVNATPEFDDFDFEDVNAITTSLTGNNQKVILNYSDLKISIPTDKKASAKKYASIISYEIDTISKPYSDTETVEATITKYNKTTISVKAIDSRNNSKEVFITLDTPIIYEVLTNNGSDCSRVNNTGELVDFNFNGTWWNNSFGSQANNLTATYKYKEANSSEEYTPGTTQIIINREANTFNFSGKLRGDGENNGFKVENSYEVVVTVSDALSSVDFYFQIIAGVPAIKILGNKVIEVNGCNGLLNYSSEEKQIGYLFDEPLYGRTITLTMTGSGATNIQLDFDPSFINMSKTLFKKRSGSNVYMYNGFYNRTDDNARVYYRNYDRTVNVQLATNNSSDQWTIYLVLEYTK